MLRVVDCSRKQAYPTEREAEQVAEHQMSLNPELVLRAHAEAPVADMHPELHSLCTISFVSRRSLVARDEPR